MGKRENEYQAGLIKRIYARFPDDCLVLKNDEQYIQGIPDLTVLVGPWYALLEVKRNEKEMERPRPNQEYYLEFVQAMGAYSSFIYPEIEEEVLDALQQSFEACGYSRTPES